MSFQQIEQPGDNALAIRVLDRGWQGYENEVREHQQEWVDVQERTHGESEVALNSLARVMQRRLFRASAGHMADELEAGRPAHQREIDRRTALGTLAMSKLIRQAVNLETLGDARGFGIADAALDNFKDETGMPVDIRLHVPAGASDGFLPESAAGEQWYRDDESGLYVFRTRPARPSDQQVTVALESGVDIDFARMDSLFPYLPAGN